MWVLDTHSHTHSKFEKYHISYPLHPILYPLHFFILYPLHTHSTYPLPYPLQVEWVCEWVEKKTMFANTLSALLKFKGTARTWKLTKFGWGENWLSHPLYKLFVKDLCYFGYEGLKMACGKKSWKFKNTENKITKT